MSHLQSYTPHKKWLQVVCARSLRINPSHPQGSRQTGYFSGSYDGYCTRSGHGTIPLILLSQDIAEVARMDRVESVTAIGTRFFARTHAAK